MAAVRYSTLEEIATQARPYPDKLLQGCETGLCLFSAAFLGHNDAIHFALAGVETTCVDVDEERLEEMSRLYPESWTFKVDDAWNFAKRRRGKKTWDAVSADTWTGELEARSLDSLELWCSLAEKIVIATVTDARKDSVSAPEGWKASYLVRSAANGVHWLVLERE